MTALKIKRQTQLDIDKALAENPDVFEYDNVYDSMKAQDPSTSGKKEKKARYVEQLLKTAEHRQKEQERRSEKKIQKEREEEGDEFADKEAFVTSSYKEKLKELAETEARDRRERQCEGMYSKASLTLVANFRYNRTPRREKARRSGRFLPASFEASSWRGKNYGIYT